MSTPKNDQLAKDEDVFNVMIQLFESINLNRQQRLELAEYLRKEPITKTETRAQITLEKLSQLIETAGFSDESAANVDQCEKFRAGEFGVECS